MNVLLWDTETTGLDPSKAFIISNGSVLWNSETGKVSEFYEELNWFLILGKNFTIPQATIDVHGITEEALQRNGIDPVTSMSNFYKWIENFIIDNSINGNGSGENNENKDIANAKLDICAAFNLPYDLNMFKSNLLLMVNVLKKRFYSNVDGSINENLSIENCEDENIKTRLQEFENVEKLLYLFSRSGDTYSSVADVNRPLLIDSLIIDQIFHFEVDGEKVPHNLDAVGNRYGFPTDPNAHNAIYDTRRTFEVFKLQLKELKEEHNIDILNPSFEARLKRRYDRNQDYWKKSNGLDYFANRMKQVEVKI